ncbi:MAG: D-alanine--D-alanine ligase [Halioglobus sp.]|nr:D-alanine--D-alanine ligase [Halioglobus sp.]
MSQLKLRGSRIAVLLGGNSAEREVSLNSGRTVIEALQSLGVEVIAVDPSESGWAARLDGVSAAFIILHGPGGEDGSMQGLLQTMGIPYTGSGVLGSALAMDKSRSKQLWQGIDLPTAGFVTLDKDADWQGVIDRFGKVFVKPGCEGSSIGMSTAASASALRESFELASQYAGVVLAEKFIDGPEYTVAILGDKALPSIRLETDNEFYDYQAKYISNDTRYHCPSGLTADEEAEIAALSLRAFRSLGCAVWGRVDLMRDASGRFWVLEVNTVPGMTSHSLVPMAAAAAGMTIPELVQRIVELSLRGGQ